MRLEREVKRAQEEREAIEKVRLTHSKEKDEEIRDLKEAYERM